MVCFYFYHSGGAPRFSWFSCVFIWWYFCCILMCSCVLFLVRFSRVFCRAFSGVFWWFCWWYFLCFSWCFFHCVLVFFSVFFFVLVPFLFYIRFPLVVVLFFAVLFFVVFGCFFRAFFRAFCGVFLCLLSCFFSCIFSFFFLVFFSCFFFFRALGGTQDKQPQYFAFWPVLFSVLFLVVTTSEDRIYTKYTLWNPVFWSWIQPDMMDMFVHVTMFSNFQVTGKQGEIYHLATPLVAVRGIAWRELRSLSSEIKSWSFIIGNDFP